MTVTHLALPVIRVITAQSTAFDPVIAVGRSNIVLSSFLLDGNATARSVSNESLISFGVGAHDGVVRQVWLKDALYGVRIAHDNERILITENKIEDAGWGVLALTGSPLITDLIVSDNILSNSSISIDRDVERVTISGNIVHTTDAVNGIAVASSRDISIVGNVVQSSAINGIHVETTAGQSATSRVTIQGNVVLDSTESGIYVAKSHQVVIAGNTVARAGTTGINLSGATDVIIKGNTVDASGGTNIGLSENSGTPVTRVLIANNISKNSGQTTATTRGINADTTVTDITITGNHSYDDQGTKTQDVGIRIGATDANIVVTDNNVVGNSTSAMTFVSGIGASDIVRNNKGFVTESSGTSTIPSAATSTIVTHGLAVTPTAGDCTFVGSSDPTNSPGAHWIDTFTSTQMNLNVENDPGASNYDVSWTCSVY